jgi:hypothetical protein
MEDEIITLKAELENVKAEKEKLKAELEKLKNKETVYTDDLPIGFLQQLGKLTINQEDTWKDSPLEALNKLKIDSSGKVGELFVEMICKKSNIKCLYNGDINSKDGTYDILINDKKVEIKTARLGKNKSFQHEGLRSTGYDYLMFIDITPKHFYMTIVPKFNLKEKSVIFNRKPHLRKGTSDVFKLDFNEKIIKENLIPKKFSLLICETTKLIELSDFIIHNLI